MLQCAQRQIMLLTKFTPLQPKFVSAGRCFGSLPSRIREAGINGLLPAARVPSIYSVSPLRVLDRSLPKQREVTVICVHEILRICDPQIGNLTMEHWRMELATAAACF